MDKMKCMVVDDDPMSREAVLDLSENFPYLSIEVVCEDALQAVEAMQSHDLDLVFLDIQMPNLTGIELLRSARKDLPQVIFITSMEQYAIESYEYDVTDYIIKPLDLPRFLKAVNKAYERFQQKQPVKGGNSIFIKVDSKLIKLNYEDIVYVESDGDYVTFHAHGKKYLVHATMKHSEDRLPSAHFQRVHRSYIVNLNHIDHVGETSVHVKGERLPVSRSARPELLAVLNKL